MYGSGVFTWVNKFRSHELSLSVIGLSSSLKWSNNNAFTKPTDVP